MPVTIITQSPNKLSLSTENIKRVLWQILNKTRGPSAVTASVVRGFNALEVPYILNPTKEGKQFSNTVWVNESIDALRFAIAKKQEGATLIVGPNLVITPLDYGEIICNKNIDIILQPSEWTKKFLCSFKPELEQKIHIWPAGVEVPEKSNAAKTIDVLIYSKNPIEDNFLKSIETLLSKRGLRYKVIEYGHFKQVDYFTMLEITKVMIYLSYSESQGLALQEAWARDVPTLVYNRGLYSYRGNTFYDTKISAPYLNEQTGSFFDINTFEDTFTKVWTQLSTFTPRTYVIENLSDTVCAQKFLEIVTNTGTTYNK